MPAKDLFVIYLIQLLLLVLPGHGIVQLLKKAGHPQPWKGWVPFLNTWEMQKMTKRRMHWVFWQLIPVVGWFITPGIYIEFVKLFGRYSLGSHAAATFGAPVYFPYMAKSNDVRYIGADMVMKHKKSSWREWVDAGIFAVVAATLIRLFVFEAYVIPTGSMEKTLLVNDFLFVSKMSYGPRVPNTPLSFPFVHHTLPLVGGKSYVEWIKIPYRRWFASPVKRNDVVVFNLPAGDTVINKEGFQSEKTYYDALNELRSNNLTLEKAREYLQERSNEFPIIVRPVDKRENYVKRCVGIPGDVIKIENGILMVNGEKAVLQPNGQLWYDVRLKPNADAKALAIELGVEVEKTQKVQASNGEMVDVKTEFNDIDTRNGLYRMLLTNDVLDVLRKNPSYISDSVMEMSPGGSFFPSFYYQDTLYSSWTVNDFGPLWVPKKGASINLNPDAICKYRRIIEVYEHNELEILPGNTYKINGSTAITYTFKMDYFWMMGDNRHNSQDSRYWGFVPEDHIVGRAALIWMSWNKGPRWKRLFRSVR
jgi:signal peptidase I